LVVVVVAEIKLRCQYVADSCNGTVQSRFICSVLCVLQEEGGVVCFRTPGKQTEIRTKYLPIAQHKWCSERRDVVKPMYIVHNRNVCSPLPRNSDYLFMGYKACRRRERERTSPCLVTNTMVCPLENKETSEGGRYLKFLVIIIPRNIKIRYTKCRETY